jgi:histidine triad (HIT) family protein
METPRKTAVFPTACNAAGQEVPRLCHGTGMERPCTFCRIARGEIGASLVLRDGGVCAFLDTRPVFKGHVLVIPSAHVDDFHALAAGEMAPFWTAVQRVSRAVEKGLDAHGTFVGVNNKISQSVPHLHAHVVPRRKGDGLRGFFWPRTTYESDAEREAYADRIKAALP